MAGSGRTWLSIYPVILPMDLCDIETVSCWAVIWCGVDQRHGQVRAAQEQEPNVSVFKYATCLSEPAEDNPTPLFSQPVGIWLQDLLVKRLRQWELLSACPSALGAGLILLPLFLFAAPSYWTGTKNVPSTARSKIKSLECLSPWMPSVYLQTGYCQGLSCLHSTWWVLRPSEEPGSAVPETNVCALGSMCRRSVLFTGAGFYARPLDIPSENLLKWKLNCFKCCWGNTPIASKS